MRRKLPIFYSALMLTGVNLLLRLVSTSFQVYISGRIGAAGVGLLQLVLSVGALAMTAGMAGIRTATMYLTARQLGRKRPENVHWVLSGAFIYSLVCSGVISLGLYYFAPLIARHWIDHPQTVGALRLYACFLPLTCLCGMMTGYFTAANRIGTLTVVEVFEQLLSMTATMILLTLWAGTDPAKACQSIIFGSGIATLFTLASLVYLRMREKLPPGSRIPVRRELLEAAVPLALGDNLKAGINTTENLMVPKRLRLYPGTADPLAAFGMVCGMVFPVIMFPAAILFALAELLIPELARCAAAESQQRIRYLAKRSLRFAMLYGCLACGLAFLLAESLCLWLYKNTEVAHYLRLYALLIPMLYCDAITDAMTKGLGQQAVCVRYNILTSAMDVAFLFILLPRYGMLGYFFSFFVTHLINFILSLRRLLKIAGNVVSFSSAFLCCVGTAGAIYIASHIRQPDLRSIGFVLLWGSLLYLFKVISKEDALWLKGLVKKK